MSKYVRIITPDNRFARMLMLELQAMGVEIISESEAENKSAVDTQIYTLIDLDFCTVEELEILAKSSIVVGFSYSYINEMPEKKRRCAYFLHRPFLISDLCNLISAQGKPYTQNSIRRQKKLKLAPIGASREYLTLDSTDRSAMINEMKIYLSENEFKVISALCERRGEIVRRELIDGLLGVTNGNMSDVYICHLRRKLDNVLGVKLIYTVRGKGYMLKK